jgi:hypothetical protein
MLPRWRREAWQAVLLAVCWQLGGLVWSRVRTCPWLHRWPSWVSRLLMYLKYCKLLPAYRSDASMDPCKTHEQAHAGWQYAPEPTCDHRNHQLPLCACRRAIWVAGARRRRRSTCKAFTAFLASSMPNGGRDEFARFVCTESIVYTPPQLYWLLRERRSRWAASSQASNRAYCSGWCGWRGW